jgi:hypothetical protein
MYDLDRWALPIYDVWVGNVGLVYKGYDEAKALRIYVEYVIASKGGNKYRANCIGESVSIGSQSGVLLVYIGDLDCY